MIRTNPLFLLPLLLFSPTGGASEIIVITQPQSPLNQIQPKQLSDLYLGRSHTVSIGDQTVTVQVIEFDGNSPLRERFFYHLNGMTLKQLNAYWARLRFSGAVLPPQTVETEQEMIRLIQSMPNAIGYITPDQINSQVKTLLQLPE